MKVKAKLRVCVEIRGLSRTTIMMMIIIIIIIYIGSYKIKVTDKEHLVCMHI